jgi:hypothetical protein
MKLKNGDGRVGTPQQNYRTLIWKPLPDAYEEIVTLSGH